jgi:hypothetical protein
MTVKRIFFVNPVSSTGGAAGAGGGPIARSIIWNGSFFITVGISGNCLTSPDGITWTFRPQLSQVNSGTATNSIAWSGSRFVAVGNLSTAATSPT